MCCPKGHLFCKECIIGNLLVQKKEIKKRIKTWQNQQKKLSLEEDSKLRKEKQIKMDSLKAIEDNIAKVDTETNIENFLPDDTILQMKTIEEVAESKNKIKLIEKSEMIENCFWLPERTPEFNKIDTRRPSELLYCPLKDNDHAIKLKNLISLKLKEEDSEKYSCSVCHRDLSVQKIVALRTCGHVMCKVKKIFKVEMSENY